MKKITTFIFSILALFGSQNAFSQKRQNEAPENQNCFSESNFDQVYSYVAQQIKSQNALFYTTDGYEIYLYNDNETQMAFKKKNYTLGSISKKGIVSLAIYERANNKTVSELKKIYCKLLKLSTQ